MRVEVDSALEKQLDEIKASAHVWGRGHSDTVRYLVRYHETHKPLMEFANEINARITDFLSKLNDNIETALTKTFMAALAKTFVTMTKMADANQPVPGYPGSTGQPTEGH